MTALLAAEGVSVRIERRMLLDDVWLELHPGEVLALVGPNGAGKSTLLAVLCGDRRPDRGTVRLEGEPLSAFRPRALARRRAVLLQSNEVAFGFTVEQVIEMGRMPWRGIRDVDDDRAIDEAVRAADLHGLRTRRVPTLSGGERARVAYARTLAQQAPIRILDEPTAALDIRHQEAVLAQARVHARAGGAVLVVLHDLNLAAAYADRIAVLADGRLVACDVPHRALTADLLTRVYEHPLEVGIGADGRTTVVPVRGTQASGGTALGSHPGYVRTNPDTEGVPA